LLKLRHLLLATAFTALRKRAALPELPQEVVNHDPDLGLGLTPLITHDQNGLALENLLEVGVDDSPANLATST